MSTLHTITGKVVRCTQETNDTWTLDIDVASENRHYQAGQFISIDPHQFSVLSNWIAYLEHCKGRKEQVRAYSMASAPHEPYVSITIKPETYQPGQTAYPPLMSCLLASDWLQGRDITFKGYTGAYTLRYLDEEPYRHIRTVVHITAGSGIVPNFALLKDALHNNKHPHIHHTLINVNKTLSDIIFRQQLDELAQQHPQRLQLLHLLTRQQNLQQLPENLPSGPRYQTGRPTLQLLQQYMTQTQNTLVYACGPALTRWQKQRAQQTGESLKPRFIESVTQLVHELGVAKNCYKTEKYG
ncbi:MAG: oxidoreductase [Myxococcota bacterium]